jgi:predicted porin
MKKLLLITTAVAGLAFAAPASAEIDIDVNGYFKGYVGFADQDTDDVHDLDWKRESELHFQGETTLDNGLTVGANIEIQTENDSGAVGDSVEESYVYFSGNWGRINAGAEDGAAYLLQVAAPAADDNVDGIYPKIRFVNTPAGFGAPVSDILSYRHAPSGDADKITYLTPKFNGFQAGVSYSPSDVFTKDVVGDNLTEGMPSDDDAGEYEQLIEAAARYDGEFNGVGLHFGGGYSMADLEADSATATEDYDEWNVGAKLTFNGWGFGAAYNESNEGLDSDTEVLIVGADYTYGAYKFGVSYLDGKYDANDSDAERISAGVGYTYGPGMSFRGSVNYYDLEAGAAENEAYTILLGTDISF